MLSDFNPALSAAFIGVARSRGMISDDQANELAELSNNSSVMPSQLAVETGMLKPVEVEIVEAFLAPKDLAPGYELLDVVGYGALGVVYRARQSHLQRDVAIKAILQSRLSQHNAVARFQQEGALIGRLQHPNIVSAYDFGSHRNRLYLVMELVSGVDLSRRSDNGPIPITTALAIVRQIALGLAHAFHHRIIHRDIKPGNLLLTEAPAGFDLPPGVPLVKIADFGLARFHSSPDGDGQDTRLTMTGAALGTPMYCAPEQLSGDEIDHRSDIYALGATFFRILAGDTPFPPEKVSKIIAAKVTGQLPRVELLPADLDPEIRALLLDMMKTDPDDRIPDYETLISRIDAIGTTGAGRSQEKVTKSLGLPLRAGNTKGSKRQKILALTALLALVVSAVTLPKLLRSPALPTMIPSGWESHLFDGKTMTGWTVRGGLWSSGVDSEGGAILIGKGAVVRPLPSPPLATPPGPQNEGPSGIGFRVGIDLQEAGLAEIHFAFQGHERPSVPRMVVLLSPQRVALGTKSSADSEFVSSGRAVEFPPDEGDDPRYHEIRVERHGAYWFASFDDREIGQLPANAREVNEGLIAFFTDSTVHFEGPLVYQLHPPANAIE